MKHSIKNKHEFAVYYAQLTEYIEKRKNTDNRFVLTDQDIVHRITRVLRLQEHEQVILFDRYHHLLLELEKTHSKKELVTRVVAAQVNTQFKPDIIFFLPILKREALETALYALTEVGINTIQLMITEKTPRTITAHELARAERTIIAAAEQSKNFHFPTVLPPAHYEQSMDCVQKQTALKIFFDPTGNPLIEQIRAVHEKRPELLALMIGPEGDLTTEEKKQLKEDGFIFCALTPTILRACQAAALSGAIFRSILSVNTQASP
jgi:16S rRNA (uracil1498-N3)-methyltransferase